jgi:hypothetical protein
MLPPWSCWLDWWLRWLFQSDRGFKINNSCCTNSVPSIDNRSSKVKGSGSAKPISSLAVVARGSGAWGGAWMESPWGLQLLHREVVPAYLSTDPWQGFRKEQCALFFIHKNTTKHIRRTMNNCMHLIFHKCVYRLFDFLMYFSYIISFLYLYNWTHLENSPRKTHQENLGHE